MNFISGSLPFHSAFQLPLTAPRLCLVSPTSSSSSCLLRAGLAVTASTTLLITHLAALRSLSPSHLAIPFSEGTGDEKFWRRHKNAALHFPFKITPFAPFSVYYYQVVQPAFSALGLHCSSLVHPFASPRIYPLLPKMPRRLRHV